MENQSRYVSILRDSLSKKERILTNLLTITRQQEEYLASDVFEDDVFSDMMDVKASLVDELDTVDDGFEVTYQRIGEYIREHQLELKTEISEMQTRIREITRLSTSLQALEERNRQKLELIFAKRRKEVQGYRKSNQVVSNYYQNMSGMDLTQGNSMFNQKK